LIKELRDSCSTQNTNPEIPEIVRDIRKNIYLKNLIWSNLKHQLGMHNLLGSEGMHGKAISAHSFSLRCKYKVQD